MSGTNPLLASGASSLPVPAPAAPQQAVQQGAPGPTPADQVGPMVAGSMRGAAQQAMVQRRDAAGPELEILSRVMSEPNPKPSEVTDYLVSLVKAGQIPAKEAIQIIQSMPKDPDALRAWAHAMFHFVMHTGIHTHAAFPRSAFPGTAAPPGVPQDDGAGTDAEEPSS